ncbi:hypothetical protein EES46_13925 [Streptomyces sp. ADI98-10]|nr:hypothetical protein EES46_13925 [Streptomyces sp. ADI98-10]
MSMGMSWDATAGSSGGVMGGLRRKTGTDLDLIAIAMLDGPRCAWRAPTPWSRWATAPWYTAATGAPKESMLPLGVFDEEW